MLSDQKCCQIYNVYLLYKAVSYYIVDQLILPHAWITKPVPSNTLQYE